MTITLESSCPRCGSREVRRSRQGGAMNAILRLFLLDPYRCRSCFRRFFAPRSGGSAVSTMATAVSEKSRAAAS